MRENLMQIIRREDLVRIGNFFYYGEPSEANTLDTQGVMIESELYGDIQRGSGDVGPRPKGS